MSLLCDWARGRPASAPGGASRVGVVSGWASSLAARHRRSCSACIAVESRLAQVEAWLSVAGREFPAPPPGLRHRVLAAFDQETAGAGSPRRSRALTAPRPILGRALAAGLAVAVLGAGVGAWRLARELWWPPRTVRIELPPGIVPDREVHIVIRRADGRREAR